MYLFEALSCNGGDIQVQIISIYENVYSSRISVTVSTQLIETNIQCLHDNGSSVTSIKYFTIDDVLGISINATSEKGKYDNNYKMTACVYTHNFGQQLLLPQNPIIILQ